MASPNRCSLAALIQLGIWRCGAAVTFQYNQQGYEARIEVDDKGTYLFVYSDDTSVRGRDPSAFVKNCVLRKTGSRPARLSGAELLRYEHRSMRSWWQSSKRQKAVDSEAPVSRVVLLSNEQFEKHDASKQSAVASKRIAVDDSHARKECASLVHAKVAWRPRVSPSGLGRYFHLNCERYLVLSTMPRAKQNQLMSSSSGNANDGDSALFMTRRAALMHGGLAWEDRIVAMMGSERVVAPARRGDSFSYAETVELLRATPAGKTIFQSTLYIPYSFYGTLSSDRVQFSQTHPDFLELLDDPNDADGRLLYVIDAKSAHHAKFGHRVQVAFYALLLEHIIASERIEKLRVAEHGGVWLKGARRAESFALAGVEKVLCDYLYRNAASSRPSSILSPLERTLFVGRPSDAHWHMNDAACNGCDFLAACRSEASAHGTLSSAAYLNESTARTLRTLREHKLAKHERHSEIEDCHRLLSSAAAADGDNEFGESPLDSDPIAQTLLAVARPRIAAAALQRMVPTGYVDVDFPSVEDVAFYLTAHVDPLSGDVLAWALLAEYSARAADLLQCDARVFDHGADFRSLIVCVAARLRAVHDVNLAVAAAQLSAQCYMFGQLELSTLHRMLVEHALNDGASSPARDRELDAALSVVLMVLVHSSDWLSFGNTLPKLRDDSNMPFVDLPPYTPSQKQAPAESSSSAAPPSPAKRKSKTQIHPIRSIEQFCISAYALPVFPSLDLAACLEHVVGVPAQSMLGVADDTGDDAIYVLAQRGDEARLRAALRARLEGTRALVGAIRRADSPCKPLYRLAPFGIRSLFDYSHRYLSRMAFVLQYEATSECAKVRASRSPVRAARVLSGASIPLELVRVERCNPKRGGTRATKSLTFGVLFRLRALGGGARLPDEDFGNSFPHVVSTDDSDGELQLRTFDDMHSFQYTSPSWAMRARLGFVHVVRTSAAAADGGGGYLIEARVKVLGRHASALFEARTERARSALDEGDVAVDAEHMTHSSFLLHRRYCDDFAFANLQDHLWRMEGTLRRASIPLSLHIVESVRAWAKPDVLDGPAADDDGSGGVDPYDMRRYEATQPFSPYSAEYRAQVAACAEQFERVGALALTPSQCAVRDKIERNRLTLVHGPPGTGKTHSLALIVLTMLEAYRRLAQPCTVLLTAFTHLAIENLLGQMARMQSALVRSGAIDAPMHLLKLSEWKSSAEASPPPGIDVLRVSSRGGVDAGNLPMQSVVGGTVWALRRAFYWRGAADDNAIAANMLVVDEASQLPVVEATLPINMVDRQCGRIVLAGDWHQLGPIRHADYPPTADSIGIEGPPLHVSILECLRAVLVDASLDVDHIGQLHENFRMNAPLCRFSANALYGRRYASVHPDRRLPWQREHVASSSSAAAASSSFALSKSLGQVADAIANDADPSHSLTVVRVPRANQTVAFNEHHVEPRLIALLAADMWRAYAASSGEARQTDFWQRHLFIVTPRHVQRLAVRAALCRVGFDERLLNVDTVEKMQGQEADVVIVAYSMWTDEQLSHSDFVYHRNRINVAVTRAKSKCIVVLHDALIEPMSSILDNIITSAGFEYLTQLTHSSFNIFL
jgi:AAA domain